MALVIPTPQIGDLILQSPMYARGTVFSHQKNILLILLNQDTSPNRPILPTPRNPRRNLRIRLLAPLQLKPHEYLENIKLQYFLQDIDTSLLLVNK